jgi:hypothetical protein
MAQFTLSVQCDNDAFADGNLRPEVARILRDAAHKVEQDGDTSRKIYDNNGNHIGFFELEEN